MNDTTDWTCILRFQRDFDGLKIVDDDADVVAVKDGQFVHIGKKQPECISIELSAQIVRITHRFD